MRLISELWKDIGVFGGVDFTGKYKISSKGRVWSCDVVYMSDDGKRVIARKKGCLRKPQDNKYGYLCVILRSGDKFVTAKIHRLVATAFLINPNGLKYVNHKDENKFNNDVNNLEWCTAQYNIAYGTARERAGKKMGIPINMYTLDGEYIRSFESCNEAARILGFAQQNISRVAKGYARQTHGYIFRKS